MVLSAAALSCVVATLGSTTAQEVNFQIGDSGRFERWSHFKDYGVPGTINDPVNKAAIADGTCRLLRQKDGFFMWKDGARTQRVLDALAAAPSTAGPSHFTLSAKQALDTACFESSTQAAVRPDYDVTVMASSMQNWYHALCAPESDPSWGGAFDPAYQAQQMALTTGLMCIVGCDANSSTDLSSETMSRFTDRAGAAQGARDKVCELFPWNSGVDFSQAESLETLSQLAQPLLEGPCRCSGTGKFAGDDVRAASADFREAERFERWSHFKDYGVPGTINDPVNKAAIADGTCRLLRQKDGFFMWKDGARTQRVLNALAAAPSTAGPSHFTLSAEQALETACFESSTHEAVRPDYDVTVMASSMQNWYHALCAPESDPSWGGAFDPAYQPQQVSITTGLMCIAACDAAGSSALSIKAMSALSSPSEVCNVFPWGSGLDFSQATTLDELASLARPLLTRPCQCVCTVDLRVLYE